MGNAAAAPFGTSGSRRVLSRNVPDAERRCPATAAFAPID
jgi:hypothetical protein